MPLPIALSIPHCSARIPEAIRSTMALSDDEIIESVDFGTAEIFGVLPAAKIVKAQWSRLVVDLNRAPDQINSKGVIALTDYHGREIYRAGRTPDAEVVSMRVMQFHRPYHKEIEEMLGDATVMGMIDGHSLNGTGPKDAPDPGQRRKDITLSNNGDLNGEQQSGGIALSCTPARMQVIRQAFIGQGFTVALNHPYQGGYITRHYGPVLAKQGRFAVQIEMNQDLYMQPGDLEPDTHRLAEVQQRILKGLETVCATMAST